MRKYFTLIEMIVVIVIIGILAAIIVPNISQQQSKAIVSMMNSNIRILQTAVDTYSLKNNNQLPTFTSPTLEKPQYIDIERLYPKYIKSKPDYDKVKGQKYWVDVYGKVWGSTTDSPYGQYESDNFVEWKHQKSAVGYNIYKINEQGLLSSANKRTINHLKFISPEKDLDLLKIQRDGNRYLVSSIDEYGLESAPSGLAYNGKQDWFKPIVDKEGTFTFDFISYEKIYLDGFSSEEVKPEGTSVSYEFASEESEFREYVTDITKLSPTKHVKVKVTTKSYAGKYPSVLDMRILFHYDSEETPVLLEELSPQTKSLLVGLPTLDGQNKDSIPMYRGTIPEGKKIIDIQTGGSIPTVFRGWSGYIQRDNGTGMLNLEKAPSLSELPSGATVVFIPIHSLNNQSENIEIGGLPLIDAYHPIVLIKPNPNIQFFDSKPNSSASPPKEDPFKTIQTLSFMTSSTDGNLTRWIKSEITDKQPEGTQILYKYSTNSGSGWSHEVDSIDKLGSSVHLKVKAYLQVKESLIDKVEPPEVINVTIYSEKGATNMDLLKPKVIIKPITDGKEFGNINTGSKVEWAYEATDPKGHEIVNAEWRGQKQTTYTSGKYYVEVRVMNDSNVWSDWVRLDFSVFPTPTKKNVAFNIGQYSKILYVDATNGNDLNEGSLSKPLQTFDKAQQMALNGELIYLKAGTYTSTNPQWSKNVDIKGENGNTVLVWNQPYGRPHSSGNGYLHIGGDVDIYNLVIDTKITSTYANYLYVSGKVGFYNVYFRNFANLDYDNIVTLDGSEVAIFNSLLGTGTLSNNFIRFIGLPALTMENNYGPLTWRGTPPIISKSNIINMSPSLSPTYQIYDDKIYYSGEGTNPDGTQAHIGLYGGPNAWR